MRDFETIQTAMTAAETGELLLSTLHTVGAAKTIDRIVDVFPALHMSYSYAHTSGYFYSTSYPVKSPIKKTSFLLKKGSSSELPFHLSQREIELDTESYASALRAALRQTPDVILLGEMRDFEIHLLAVRKAKGHNSENRCQ